MEINPDAFSVASLTTNELVIYSVKSEDLLPSAHLRLYWGAMLDSNYRLTFPISHHSREKIRLIIDRDI